jgi:uncharacterized protein
MSPPWSQPLDVDRLADAGVDIDFAVPLAELPGLRSLRAGVGGDVKGHARFGREQGTAVAQLAWSGCVTLECQRCMQRMQRPLQAETKVALVGSEEQAARVAGELEPVLARDGRISIAELLTEELLLALPIVPLHEASAECAPAEDAPQDNETQRPFAGLADLLKS